MICAVIAAFFAPFTSYSDIRPADMNVFFVSCVLLFYFLLFSFRSFIFFFPFLFGTG